jgi:hypothetical protein
MFDPLILRRKLKKGKNEEKKGIVLEKSPTP